MEANNYILLVANTYLENGEKIGYGKETVEIRKELFQQQLIRVQKVEERDNFVTKKEFLNHCLIALHLIKEYVDLQGYLQINRLNERKESTPKFWFDQNGTIQDIPLSVVDQNILMIQNEIDNFDFDEYLTPMGNLTTGIYKSMCNNDIKFLEDIFENFNFETDKPQQPKPTPLSLSNTTKIEHGIMENFEIEKDISQGGIRGAIRVHIQIQYEISLEEFLRTNHLADEFFYINYIDKNQKERLQELEKEVSFFDISEGKEVTDDIADQWYNESITRDHYWYYKEYQIFLKERLTELEKIKAIEKGKKINININKELEDFEIFNKNLKEEITALFNQSVSKNEALNTYYKDYLPKYLTRINEIISHTEQMQNEFKLYYPELESDLVKLNAITSKFKKSVLNDLEITLNTVLKIDYERLLFEYLNITNKLETDLKIEGKKISDFFGLFYNRMLHIKLNPKPQQTKNLAISDTSTIKKNSFENKFDRVKESEIIAYFTENLVDKKYITDEVLNKYLKQAFELKTPPTQRFSFEKLITQAKIRKVFYEYFKITAGKPNGQKREYVKLLGEYFNGFDTEKLMTNFSK